MPDALDFTDEALVSKYLKAVSKKTKPLRHAHYYDNASHANEMAVHLLGTTPAELLEDYRPNEPQEVYKYRLRTYQPFTKSSAQKIINTISRIQNNSNYTVNYEEPPSKLKEGEDIKTYLEQKFPVYGSFFKWVFSIVLEADMSDPNALCCVYPIKPTKEKTEMFEPIGHIYRSDQVVDYELDQYYTILSDEQSEFGTAKRKGKIYIVVTKSEIIEYRQTGEKSGEPLFTKEVLYTFGFDMTPAFFLGGNFLQHSFPPVFESFISGILPFWNASIRMQSDLDAQFVTSVYLERAEIEIECDAPGCQFVESEGYHGILTTEGECQRCTRCKGEGFITGRSPYGVTRVKKEELSDKPQIFPGVEYITKPIDVVQLLREEIKSLIDRGFSAINMDILNKVGENQSGIAKTIDRGDFNNFLLKISDNIFDNIIHNSIKYINQWRYGLFLERSELKENLPVINKPTNFDTMTISMINQEIGELKNSGVSDETLSMLEKDLVDKKFSNDTLKRSILDSIITLDPMPNKAEDDKMTILANRGVTQEDYIISSNIKPFILRALEEKGTEFFDMKLTEKMDIMKEYASEKATSLPPIPIVTDGGSQENSE